MQRPAQGGTPTRGGSPKQRASSDKARALSMIYGLSGEVVLFVEPLVVCCRVPTLPVMAVTRESVHYRPLHIFSKGIDCTRESSDAN